MNADRRVVWLTGAGHAAAHTWELIFPAVAVPLSRDLGLSFADTVELSFVLYLMFGLGAPLAGWLSDHIGPRRVLILCLGLGGASGAAVALATDLVAMRWALGGLGLAASLYHPPGLALLSTHFRGGIGKALALNGIIGNFGIAGTPFLAGLLASLWGWRSAYWVLAAPALVMAAVALLFPFQDRSEKVAATKSEATPVRWWPLLAFAVAVMSSGLAYRLNSLVMPALFQERLPSLTAWARGLDLPVANADNLAATLFVTAAYGMGIFGQYYAGKIADRRSLLLSYLGFHAGAAPVLLVAAFVAGPVLVALLFLYLFLAIGMQPLENSLVARLTPAVWRGRAYAGKFILSFGVGSLGTYVVGWVLPWGGLGASLQAAAGLEFLLVVVVVALWRTQPEVTDGR